MFDYSFSIRKKIWNEGVKQKFCTRVRPTNGPDVSKDKEFIIFS
jgi:hypothetical protein